MYFLLVFVAVTLGKPPARPVGVCCPLNLFYSVTEVFYLNKALALFNTGGSSIVLRAQPAITDARSLFRSISHG